MAVWKDHLRFGIPGLDDLFGAVTIRSRSRGIGLNRIQEPVTIAIIGPVGSGKSLLALHLASRYLADHITCETLKAIYLSTDLTYDRASKAWRSFRLDYPNLREIPFLNDPSFGVESSQVGRKVDFAEFDPLGEGPDALNGYLRGEVDPAVELPMLGLVDFISKPVGDAWGFASRVLGSLGEPCIEKEEPRHFVVVDTVEGFESIVGERDETGEESSLRARLERLIHAGRKKCHLVFVAEDRGDDHPLTHIADVLIRIRADQDKADDYRVRTVEVEKARGQAVERGQHHMLIRTGRGSLTGNRENPDDPRTANAYVMIVPSLHAVNRRVMSQNPSPDPGSSAMGAPAYGATGSISGDGAPAARPDAADAPNLQQRPADPHPESEPSVDPRGARPAGGQQPVSNAADEASSGTYHAAPAESSKENASADPRLSTRAGFGFPYLDEMLGGDTTENPGLASDVIGIQHGTVAALLGDANSQKTSIGLQFLMRGFQLFAERLAEMDKKLAGPSPKHWRMPSSPGGTAEEFWGKIQEINWSHGGGWSIKELDPNEQKEFKPQAVRGILASQLYHLAIRKLFRSWHQKLNELTDLKKAVGEIENFLPLRVTKSAIYSQHSTFVELSEAIFQGYWPSEEELREPERVLSAKRALKERPTEEEHMAVQKSLRTRLNRIEEVAAASARNQGRRVDNLKFLRELKELKNKLQSEQRAMLITLPELCECLSAGSTGSSLKYTNIAMLYSVLRERSQEEKAQLKFVDFLRIYYPFVVALLLPDTIKTFSEKMSADAEPAPLDSLWDLARCIACSNLRRSYRECQNSDEGIQTFLGLSGSKRLPYGVFAAEYLDSPTNETVRMAAALKDLCNSLPTDESAWVRPPNWDAVLNALAPIFGDNGRAKKPRPGKPCDEDWQNTQTEDRNRLLWPTADEAYFTKLIKFSPATHPFAAKLGWSHAKDGAALRSLIVAGVLELWRANLIQRSGRKLDPDKTVGDDEELSLRFSILDNPPDQGNPLRKWLDCFQPARRAQNEWNDFLNSVGSPLEPLKLENQGWKVWFSLLAAASRRIETVDHPTWKKAWRLEEYIRKGCAEFGPGLLITTDFGVEKEIRRRYETWLDKLIGSRRIEIDQFKEVVMDHFDRWMIVRRLEVHYMPAPTLHMIIRRCITAVANTLFPDPLDKELWQVRVVVDGLALMRSTYPQVERDPLFLPALKFLLERHKATSLVLSTQAGTPLSVGEDKFERAVADLFTTHIRTWRVFFYGEPCVAITVLPPSNDMNRTPIRQLTGSGERISVNRNFELFEGLERGLAKQVGLEIRLAGGTGPRRSYIDVMQALMGEVFVGPMLPAGGHSNQIVKSEDSLEWTERLRDFGKLKRKGHSEDTVLVQLDEYWSFQRSGALRSEKRYLEETCQQGDHIQNDPLDLFQPTLADPIAGDLRRKDRFDWGGYFVDKDDPLASALRKDGTSDGALVDRIPFYWDFGFLLCDQNAWTNASKEKLHVWAGEDMPANTGLREWQKTVGGVWEQGRRIQEGALHGGPEPVTWRVFMEAAKNVGAVSSMRLGEPAPAFDLAIRGGESLSCLILEMWASEVYQKYKNGDLLPALFGRFTKRSWSRTRTQGLIGLLAEPDDRSLKVEFGRAMSMGQLPKLRRHAMELFKATLLLREVLDLGSVASADDPWGLHAREPHPNAVASRHWFSTACDMSSKMHGRLGLTPVRMPGHFSVRGDWFLGVAEGSQSYLLADRALDLLSSRRGNIERLQQGLGLPVRKVSIDGSGLRTPLFTIDENGRRDWVRYNELRSLGAADEAADWKGKQDFHWLWRSALGDYDAQSRTFQRGVAWILHWWHNMIPVRGTQWKNGFFLYDELVRYEEAQNRYERKPNKEDKDLMENIFDRSFDVRSLWEFPEMVDSIVNGLKRSTPQRDEGPE